MEKVLIWDISFKLSNIGGPAGYLYNLHEYLKLCPNPSITFLSDLYPLGRESIKDKRSFKSRLLENPVIWYINDIIGELYKKYHTTRVKLPPSLNLDEYDYIHFHRPHDVTCHKKILTSFHGKLICTCHSPSLVTDEIIMNQGGVYKWLRPIMLRQELEAYKAADYLMFPCKEAREPYEKEPRAKFLFSQMENKFFYCPSAILDIDIDKSKMQKLASLGIPENAFVITYFGRHNEVKGYDILKALGVELLEKHENLYFLCAGKGPIPSPQHPRWIELGFINNTNELLQQSDLYILPNRDTYFDLVVLEVLRSGTPILLSETGGNRYFKGIPQELRKGIRFFDVENIESICSLVSDVIQCKRLHPSDYMLMRKCNRDLWEKRFTMSRYVQNYIEQLIRLTSCS